MQPGQDQPVVPSRYQLIELHGEGSLGRVWRAHDAALGREVALKELKPACARDGEARRRFLREAQVTSQLEHPYIVPVHEVCAERTLFYTMTFVRGRTLQDVISELHAEPAGSRAFSERRTRLLEIFARVCEAVAYANSRGVVHRDLKPSNIMLGAFGEVLVLDWGLAKVKIAEGHTAAQESIELDADLAGDFTVTGRVMGTPGYMAPEQAAGLVDQIDGRTDVYALGAILFKILTGKTPHKGFEGDGLPAYLKQIVEAPLPTVRSLQPRTPLPLEAICARALEKEPARRYATALDLGADVRSWLEGQPTTAYRETVGQRLVRWLARHQALAQAGAFAVLAACIISAGIIWQTWSEVRTLRHVELGILETHVNQIHAELAASLRDLRGSTNLIAHTVRIGDFVRTLSETDAARRQAARTRATELLYTVASNKPDCRRIALIGSRDDYRELVAVEFSPAARSIRVVADKDLRALGRSPHFVHIAEVLRAQPTEFYLSHFRKLDADQQSDELILMSVEHLHTDPDCWLIVQVDYRPFFATLLDDPHIKQMNTFVCDEDGRLLFANQTSPDDAADTAAFFGQADQESFADADYGTGRDVVFARKLYYDPRRQERYLGVVMVAPYHAVLAGQLTNRYLLLGVLVPTLLVMVAVVSVLSRYLLRARGNA